MSPHRRIHAPSQVTRVVKHSPTNHVNLCKTQSEVVVNNVTVTVQQWTLNWMQLQTWALTGFMVLGEKSTSLNILCIPNIESPISWRQTFNNVGNDKKQLRHLQHLKRRAQDQSFLWLTWKAAVHRESKTNASVTWLRPEHSNCRQMAVRFLRGREHTLCSTSKAAEPHLKQVLHSCGANYQTLTWTQWELHKDSCMTHSSNVLPSWRAAPVAAAHCVFFSWCHHSYFFPPKKHNSGMDRHTFMKSVFTPTLVKGEQ